jgi:hypothetical protein
MPRQPVTKWSGVRQRKERPKALCLKAGEIPVFLLGGGVGAFSSLCNAVPQPLPNPDPEPSV